MCHSDNHTFFLLSKHDNNHLWHDPNLAASQPRVYLTREAADQGRAGDAAAVEGNVQLPVAEGSRRRLAGGTIADSDQCVVFPHELRNGDAADSVSEPLVAPDLPDRVPRPHGGVAVPLLPPRRAACGAGPPRGRPPRAARHGAAHGGAAASHRRHREHSRGGGGRGGGGGGARSVQEDGGFVLGRRGRSC